MSNEDIVREFIQRRMPSPPATGTVALVALHNLIAERDEWASKAAANLRGWNEATNRAEAWEEALHRWGRHERDCTALDPGGSCSCGLTPFAWPDDYQRDRDDKLAADAREAYIAERESETA